MLKRMIVLSRVEIGLDNLSKLIDSSHVGILREKPRTMGLCISCDVSCTSYRRTVVLFVVAMLVDMMCKALYFEAIVEMFA